MEGVNTDLARIASTPEDNAPGRASSHDLDLHVSNRARHQPAVGGLEVHDAHGSDAKGPGEGAGDARVRRTRVDEEAKRDLSAFRASERRFRVHFTHPGPSWHPRPHRLSSHRYFPSVSEEDLGFHRFVDASDCPGCGAGMTASPSLIRRCSPNRSRGVRSPHRGKPWWSPSDDGPRREGPRAPALSEAMVDRVHVQEQTLEGVHANDIRVTLPREHDETCPSSARNLNFDLADPSSDATTIRKVERPGVHGLHSEVKGEARRNPCVRGAGVHDQPHRGDTSGGPPEDRVREHLSLACSWRHRQSLDRHSLYMHLSSFVCRAGANA